MDGVTDILLRCGVEADSPYIKKAMKALLAPDVAGQYKPWMAAGDALDFDGRGGNKTMTAWILSMTRMPEDTPILADEINLSFSHLSGALEHKCINDFSKKGTKFRYYKPFVKFPGENHICILANTSSWMTTENMQIAKTAMTHCYVLMKDAGYIMFRKPKEFGSSYVGPFNFHWNTLDSIDMNDFQMLVNNQNHFTFGFWLRDLIRHPKWALQTIQPYEFLSVLLEEDILMDFIPDNTKKGFRHLLGIEPYWGNTTAVKCDLSFAVLKACWSKLKS
jgi:hypothetical protein